jgi:D-cysteine desulfhydrase
MRSRGEAEQGEKVFQLLKKHQHVGLPNSTPREAVMFFGEYVGPGYAIPIPEMVKMFKLKARREGFLLSPV